MKVIELTAEMRTVCQKLRENGHQISFVPTMGALHIGHASLIKSARSSRDDKTEAANLSGQVQVSESKRQLDKLDVSGGGDKNAAKPRLKEEGETLNSRSKAASDATTRRAVTSGDCPHSVVVVSIFVNQKQFSNPNDFANYPNTLDSDLELCKSLKVDYVFIPSAKEMYPENRLLTTCTVLPPDTLADDLEGKSRPGHFAGMLTIVCKLFNIIQPHRAFFGEKDYQQLVLVSRMSQDLNLGVEVVAGKTVRDPDMLPLSSRNVRLTRSQRKVAPVMYKILEDVKLAIESRKCHLESASCRLDLNSIIFASMLTTLYLNLDNEMLETVNVDYLEVRCSKDVSRVSFNEDLKVFDCQEGCVSGRLSERIGDEDDVSEDRTLNVRLLTSVIVGEVRLLDNIEVRLNEMT